MSTEPLEWEPSLSDPLKGSIGWPVPDNHSVAITLFKDPRTHELEDKDWTFVIEDVSVKIYKKKNKKKITMIRETAIAN